MKKIKVLQFPIANHTNGISHYILENWKWIDKEKFQCDFVTMSKTLDYAEDILRKGSKIFYISCYAEDNRLQFIKEFENVLKQGYDIVHLHTKQWKSFLVEELCVKYRVPCIIVHSHSTGIETIDPVKREEEKLLHEKVKSKFNDTLATDFWACSHLAAEFLFGNQISSEKIKILPNAIELKRFYFNEDARKKYRSEYGLDDCFVIGHVGRFAYSKNHKFLVNVFHKITKSISNARLVLIGDGQLVEEVKEQVYTLNLQEQVSFLGIRDDVNSWYQAMDLFCLPSRFEGLPLSIIEAQAAGLPCIGSNLITDEVKIGQRVSLLPLDEEVWKKQIIRLSASVLVRDDSVNRKKLIDAGFDICNQIKYIESYYETSRMRDFNYDD